MGKEGELWDDSALITAFDDAISKYKKMHGMKQLNGSKAGEQTNGTGEGILTSVDENNDAKRQAEEDSTLEEISNELYKDNQQEPNWISVSDEQNAHQGYPSTQSSEDYNQLLNQYNEIEEQRQKIMQQLQYFNYWNPQEAGPSQNWGSWGSTQQNPCCPNVTNQPNQSFMTPPYNPYINQCMVAPCYLGGSCTNETSGVACNGQSSSSFIEDATVTKAALAAAEKAISSLKIENSEKQEEIRERQVEAGETDLNAVFNAWYTAGFYTGKYLAEHSVAKRHHG